MFFAKKTFGHELGLTCAFRQWRADSHCNLIHGYALQFEFTFGCGELDERQWVVDFGGLKPLKEWLAHMFDHTYLAAADDPQMDTFLDLAKKDLVDLRIVSSTGCERFAELAFREGDKIVKELTANSCWVHSVAVREHQANGAIFEKKPHPPVAIPHHTTKQ